MSEYWQNVSLIALAGIVVALAVLVAVDLKREWARTADARIRRLISSALDARELEQVTGPHPVVPTSEGATVQELSDRVDAAAQAVDDRARGSVQPSPGQLLVPPPMVGQDTLRDWFIHYRKDRDAWTEVVAEFYSRAAQDPEIADYFGGVDWPELKRHFLAALLLVTHAGVTRALPAAMAEKHSGVRNSAGDPITPEIFDRTIGVLVDVLRERLVPEDTLAQLGRVVGPFRMAIAREPRVHQAELVTPVQDPIDEALAYGIERYNAEQRARAEVRPDDHAARTAWPTWRDQRGPGVTDGDS